MDYHTTSHHITPHHTTSHRSDHTQEEAGVQLNKAVEINPNHKNALNNIKVRAVSM
jgi:hypothetical protein